MKIRNILVLFVPLLLCHNLKADDMVFNATVTHKFVWTDSNGNIMGGW